MEQGFWRLLALSLTCGVGGHLLPGGEGGAYGKHWKLLCGVCLLLVLLEPLLGLANGTQSVQQAIQEMVRQAQDEAASYDTQPKREQSIKDLDAALAAEALRVGLCEQFSIRVEDVTVSVRLTPDGEQIAMVNVGLSGEAIWKDSHAMTDWIQRQTQSEVRIYLS